MILSRAPTRITLGGGGTDLKSYYSKYGGFLIAGAIDRYCTILANKRFYDSIRLSYSKTEIADTVSEINHRIFRSALELLGINRGIELHSTADVPAGCGLGTSSAFTVALLNALHTYKRDFINQKQLAHQPPVYLHPSPVSPSQRSLLCVQDVSVHRQSADSKKFWQFLSLLDRTLKEPQPQAYHQ